MRKRTGCQRFLQATGLFVAIFREEGLNLTQADSITSICDSAPEIHQRLYQGEQEQHKHYLPLLVYIQQLLLLNHVHCIYGEKKEKEKKNHLITDASQSLRRESFLHPRCSERYLKPPQCHWSLLPCCLGALP